MSDEGKLMHRRSFLKVAATVAAIPSFPTLLRSPPAYADYELAPAILKAAVTVSGRLVPPLYTVAYVDPALPNQQGQEAVVARYPMALVSQDNRPLHRRWRDSIKAINPNIVFLAYQMTILETTSPGPGHNVLRRAQNSWVRSLWGSEVRVEEARRRVFDPRSDEWKQAFLDACSATLLSYPYDGLFLDQCSVFAIHHPLESIRREMRVNLSEVLIELRRQHPTAILIGNSVYNFRGLNGKMSEDRKHLFAQELLRWSDTLCPT